VPSDLRAIATLIFLVQAGRRKLAVTGARLAGLDRRSLASIVVLAWIVTDVHRYFGFREEML
jgi:hypothetical protein